MYKEQNKIQKSLNKFFKKRRSFIHSSIHSFNKINTHKGVCSGFKIVIIDCNQ